MLCNLAFSSQRGSVGLLVGSSIRWSGPHVTIISSHRCARTEFRAGHFGMVSRREHLRVPSSSAQDLQAQVSQWMHVDRSITDVHSKNTITGITQVNKIFCKSIFFKKAQAEAGKMCFPVALSVAHWERGLSPEYKGRGGSRRTLSPPGVKDQLVGKGEMKIATPGSSSTPDGVGFKNNNRKNVETRNQTQMPGRQKSSSS